MKTLSLFCALGLALGLVATRAEDAKKDAEAKASSKEDKSASDSTQVAVIKTTEGDMVVQFWPEVAPKTVENFKTLAKKGFFDGTAFHRIIKGFMIQGGDPNTKDVKKEGEFGQGGPGYTINAEFNNKRHQSGVISMARGPDINSAGSQFFICDGDASNLDHQYTAFGKLIKGEDVLRKIADTPVVPNQFGERSKPTKRVEIKSVQLVAADSVK